MCVLSYNVRNDTASHHSDHTSALMMARAGCFSSVHRVGEENLNQKDDNKPKDGNSCAIMQMMENTVEMCFEDRQGAMKH